MTEPVLPAPETGNDASAVKPLAPGFRFHPTDEEIISYYLKRKFQGTQMRFDAIGEVNVYNHEPSALAEHSRVKTKDQEWFFFCALEKKHNSPTVINRATKKGYWKKTGVDKEIKRGKNNLIGVVKTLVFYTGRAPKGNRTNWVIHEYHLVVNKREEIDEDNNDEPLARECLQLPLIQYKRNRQIHSFGRHNNSSQATHDNSSFPSKTGDTISPVKDTMEDKKREPLVATMVPTSSSTELINHLEKEKQQMGVERETYQLDLMSAEVMVNFLQGKIDALRAENEELKKTNTNNG
ncbi:unnamed protein product [Eruca vesicaria subsp. sativa]|uniref:NAC domain-containing protein n=1 Tax=Eruca vesicaria subsp. sativa TaxID=29727 RepID=A0ABC8ILZ5_ERUVS|nr:unnamed protein product [Eruca vesicaria subsp. sativa]